MTTPTPQPACSPLDYSVRSDGATIHFAAPNGATRAIVTTFCDQELLRLLKNAPETARLLRELVERVGDYEHLLADAQSSAFDAGDEKEQAHLDGMIGLFDATFTPLLTQIQKLEGGGE